MSRRTLCHSVSRVLAAAFCRQRAKLTCLTDDGRSNVNRQGWLLDQDNALVRDRFPCPFLRTALRDVEGLGVAPGDLAEVHDDGATHAMIHPTLSARAKETFKLLASRFGPQGSVIDASDDELVMPNCEQTWANVREFADASPVGPGNVVQVVGARGRTSSASAPLPARWSHTA